jgi:hypothetical protein
MNSPIEATVAAFGGHRNDGKTLLVARKMFRVLPILLNHAQDGELAVGQPAACCFILECAVGKAN